MAYARYETLKKLAEDSGFSFVQTNEFGKAGKSHLLQLRYEKLVNYTGVGMPGYRLLDKHGITLHYADKLANWYSITFKGLQKLLSIWPDNEVAKDLAQEAFRLAFSTEEMARKEVSFRTVD
jgi:hypothetical protein